MDKRKLIIIVSGVAIVLFSYFSMQWLSGMKKNPNKKPPKEILRSVKAESVKYKDYTISIEAMGRVTSHSQVVLISEVRGEIMQGDIAFKVGESFKKGDLLVKLDDEIELYNMKSRKSSFLNAVAGMLPDLKETLPERYENWREFLKQIDVDKNLPNLPEIKTTQERIFMASRNILTNYYSIKSAEANFESYHIHAPFDGTITETNMEVGAVANPGTKLGTIINTVHLELEVPVEVEDAKWLNVGNKVNVKSVRRSSTWEGKIVRKSQNVNPNTQAINVYISLNSSSKNPIYKGEYLTAIFPGIKLYNVMEIPRNAIFNRNVVFTVVDGLLHHKVVNIQKINEDKLFFDGIPEGTDVVAEPLINAAENSKVQILGRE